MAKIDELLQELCPDGVEYKPIKDCIVSLTTGINPRNHFVLNGECSDFYYITGKNLNSGNLIIDSATDKVDLQALSLINKRAKLSDDMLLFAGTGTIGKMAYIEIYSKDWTINETVFAIKTETSQLLTKYLMYMLHNWSCIKQYICKVSNGSVPHLKVSDLLSIVVPVPPLPIQQHTVEVLDTFTDAISNLEEELALREKQFEFYREQLFSAYDADVKRISINDLFQSKNGYTPSTKNSDFWTNGNIPWFKMEDIRDNGRILNDSYSHVTPSAVKRNSLFKANSIIISTSATIGEHALITVEHLANQRFVNLSPKDEWQNKLDMKYIYYYMFIIAEWCKNHVIQGSFNSVDMPNFFRQKITVPSLERQQEIVEVLDTFEAMIANIREEIVLRTKQYEYYREKLLSFGN